MPTSTEVKELARQQGVLAADRVRTMVEQIRLIVDTATKGPSMEGVKAGSAAVDAFVGGAAAIIKVIEDRAFRDEKAANDRFMEAFHG